MKQNLKVFPPGLVAGIICTAGVQPSTRLPSPSFDIARELFIQIKTLYRPVSKTVLAGHRNEPAAPELFLAETVSGNWSQTTKQRFANGRRFGQIFQPQS